MDIRPIKSEADYATALHELDQLWEAKPDTPESDRLELLSILVEAFERERYPIPPPDRSRPSSIASKTAGSPGGI